MNQEEAAFTYLWEKFPRLSEAKLKEGDFIGPKIQDLINKKILRKAPSRRLKDGLGQF